MFFLGFAGTFLPYLLLTAILLIFSLGMGNDAVCSEKSMPEEKIIVLDENIQTIDVADCFNFSDSGTSTSSHSIKAICLIKKPLIKRISLFLLRPNIHDINKYFSDFEKRYFGLSPPQIVV